MGVFVGTAVKGVYVILNCNGGKDGDRVGIDVSGGFVGGLLVGYPVGTGTGKSVEKQLSGGSADKVQILSVIKSENALTRVNPLGNPEIQLPSNALTMPNDTTPTSKPPRKRGPPESPEHVVDASEDAHKTTLLSIVLPALLAYAASHTSSSTTKTVASSKNGDAEPLSVLPCPIIVNNSLFSGTKLSVFHGESGADDGDANLISITSLLMDSES